MLRENGFDVVFTVGYNEIAGLRVRPAVATYATVCAQGKGAAGRKEPFAYGLDSYADIGMYHSCLCACVTGEISAQGQSQASRDKACTSGQHR